MIITYYPPEGCSIYDMVLNTYTTLNLMTKFIVDNNIQNLDLVSTVGQGFTYDTDFIYDGFVYNEIIEDGMIYCTGTLKQDTKTENNLLTELPDILASENDTLFLV